MVMFVFAPLSVMVMLNLVMFTWTAIVFCINSAKTSQTIGFSRTKQRYVLRFLWIAKIYLQNSFVFQIPRDRYSVFIDGCVVYDGYDRSIYIHVKHTGVDFHIH